MSIYCLGEWFRVSSFVVGDGEISRPSLDPAGSMPRRSQKRAVRSGTRRRTLGSEYLLPSLGCGYASFVEEMSVTRFDSDIRMNSKFRIICSFPHYALQGAWPIRMQSPVRCMQGSNPEYSCLGVPSGIDVAHRSVRWNTEGV